MKRLNRAAKPLLGLALLAQASALLADCGHAGSITIKQGDSTVQASTRVFADGSIAVRAPLAVNPDGGPASYTVGDHGFTYMANGLSHWVRGQRLSCKSECMAALRLAEQRGFAAGTATFCVYGMEVEPFKPGQALSSCGEGRHVAGNGLGKIKWGPQLETLAGGQVQSYVSTTALTHQVQGQTRYLNSEQLPIAVAPSSDLLGRVVWVGGAGLQATLAVVGDIGPAFGEGSIALHQHLRTGRVTPQKPGPIPLAQRCQTAELALAPPFQSRPDAAQDSCRAGAKPRSASDVRAYSGMGQKLDFVVLGQAAFERRGLAVQTEVTDQALADLAHQAGHDEASIAQKLACLGPR